MQQEWTQAKPSSTSYYCTGTTTYESVFNSCDIGVVVLNSERQVVNWNRWMSQFSGISEAKAQGCKLASLFTDLSKSNLNRAINNALEKKQASVISHSLNRYPLPLRKANGNRVDQHIIVKPLSSPGLEDLCTIQVFDISSAVSREKQLLAQARVLEDLAGRLVHEKEKAQVTLQSIADAVITTDDTGIINSMNVVAEKLTGWPADIAIGRPVSQVFCVVHEEKLTGVTNPVTVCLNKRIVVSNDQDLVLIDHEGNKRAITESTAPIVGANNELLGSVLVFRDVTDARQLTAKLNWQAKHDPLTGLMNRSEFETQLHQLLTSTRTSDTIHTFLYLDLDQFKVVNDTCGHSAGDELLRQLSALLQEGLRENDLIVRLGGDEFGVLLRACNKDDGLHIANNLRRKIENFRFAWGERIFAVGASIGLVDIEEKNLKVEDILSAADSACYVAKDLGRNRVHVHCGDRENASAHQLEMRWASRIQSALDDNRFCLFFQKISPVQGSTYQTDHYEVLVRMIGKDGSIIPPGAFIPAAERFNLMSHIDRWVVRHLFQSLDDVKKTFRNQLPVFGINLSGTSLNSENFLADVLELLSDSRFPTEKLCFEITETSAIANLNNAIHFIKMLKAKGCSFALDDFGSGLSSFAYLKSLPVDFLKIDGHFVKDIAEDPINRAFVESINQIGHVMGLTTIAEFVENDATLKVLGDIGVDYAQGYGVHIPAPLADLRQTNAGVFSGI